MKRTQIMLFILLAMGLPTLLSGQSIPSISFSQSEYDFGVVEMGTVVEEIISYENTGSADLIVSKVKPGCGCTKVAFEADTLAPGEHGSFKLIFDTANRLGEERLSVTVWSNAGKGIHRLKVNGRVEMPEKEGHEQ